MCKCMHEGGEVSVGGYLVVVVTGITGDIITQVICILAKIVL